MNGQLQLQHVRARPVRTKPGTFTADLSQEQPATYRDPDGMIARALLPPPPSPEDVSAFRELCGAIAQALGTLEPRSAAAVRMYFGIGGDGTPRTLEQVGAELGVTRERVRQILMRALRRLRHPSRSVMLRDHYGPACRRAWRLASEREDRLRPTREARERARHLAWQQRYEQEQAADREARRRRMLANAQRAALELEQQALHAAEVARVQPFFALPPAAHVYASIVRAADELGRMRELTFTVPVGGVSDALKLFPSGSVRVLSVTVDGQTIPVAELSDNPPNAPALRVGDVVRISAGTWHRVLELPQLYGGALLVRVRAPASSDVQDYLVPLHQIAEVRELS
jgi:RNA polymerase sigma factor (sigma-70 family)